MTGRAEMLVTGGVVWTDGRNVPGADAVAIGGGRILGVGTASELEALADRATRRIAAAGGTITPGCIDAHLHLVGWARSLVEIDLVGWPRATRCLARVAAAIASLAGDGVVVGRGWDANRVERGSRSAVARPRHGIAPGTPPQQGLPRRVGEQRGAPRVRDRRGHARSGRREDRARPLGRADGVLREHAVRLVRASRRTTRRAIARVWIGRSRSTPTA